MSIQWGPCWCNGDSTTGGHQHVESDGGNYIPDPQRDALLVELREIRNRVTELSEIRALLERLVNNE